MKHLEDRSRRRFLKTSSMLGLAVAFSPGTIIEAFAVRKSRTNKENNMTQTSATQPASEQVPDKTAIRPFQFNFPDAELTDLRRRINATKWPERELVTDASQGVQLATMQKLARYWANRLRLAQRRGEIESCAALHHRDRWARHSFHSRSLEA